MKAILVFDVQMTEDGKHICDSCPVWDEKMCGCKYDFMTGHKGCPLKPMPEKKYPIGNYFVWNMMCQAWNECLDEINATENDINAKNVALKGETE